MKKLLFIILASAGLSNAVTAQTRRTDPFDIPPPPRPQVIVVPQQPRVVVRPVVVTPAQRRVIRPIVVVPEPVVVKNKKQKHSNNGLHKGHYKNGKAAGYRERSGHHKHSHK